MSSVFTSTVKPHQALCGIVPSISVSCFSETLHFLSGGQLSTLYFFMMVSLFMSVHKCVCGSEKLSAGCFIAPCCKGSEIGGRQPAVTPFPPDSFPVPHTTAVVQPVSDICGAHTAAESQNKHTNWKDRIAHIHSYTRVHQVKQRPSNSKTLAIS